MGHTSPLTLASHLVPPAAEAALGSDGWTFLWLRAGSGYWLGRETTLGLNPGDVAILYGGEAGRYRASQLAESELATYGIPDQSLPGFVSAGERLAITGAGRANPVRPVEPGSPRAARIREAMGGVELSAVARRCRLIELLTDLLAGDLSHESVPAEVAGALERFEEWLSRKPEVALASVTLEALSQELGCSPRHLSRLFQTKFGTSFRSRQTELRLDRAKRLLTQTNAKVIHVAFDSGYHHVGLFNTLFKRRYGMTPTELRNKRKRTPGTQHVRRAAASAVTALGLAVLPVWAPWRVQGAATNEPATNGVAAQTFEVRRYEVVGNTLLPTNIISAAVGDFIGPAVDFNTIRQALSALQLAYRGRGWATVSVSLPPQKLTNGVVRVNVTEGKLTDIRIVGNRWFGTNNIRRALPGLRTNIFLNSKIFQADLDNANANPDRQLYPQIQPGPEPGTTALVLKVKDQFPLHGRFELNNQNTPGTPELRASSSLQYNNLWDHEHAVGLQYSFSPQQFKDDDHFNILDKPSIATYSGYYRIPLSAAHSVEEEVLAQPQRFGYDEVSHQFRMPPGSGSPDVTFFASRLTTDTGLQRSPLTQSTTNIVTTNGPTPVQLFQQNAGRDTSTTENLGFRVNKPMVWGNDFRGALSVGADLKNYQRASYNTNDAFIVYSYTDPISGAVVNKTLTTAIPRSPSYAQVTYAPLSLHWDGSLADKYGGTSLGLGVSGNLQGGPFSPASSFVTTTGSTNSNGAFVVGRMNFGRDIKLPDEWMISLRADGQWANQPLISNEQLGLGGTAGVRGYQEGARYGDNGWRMTIEPHTPLIDVGMVDGTLPLRFRGIAFMDYGRSYLIGAPATGAPALETLWGAGAGLNGAVGSTVDFRLVVAWALREAAGSPAGSYRIYFGVGAQF